MTQYHRIPGNFKEGHFGCVIFDANKVATKIFRRHPTISEEHTKKVFYSEVAAYQIAMGNDILNLITPKFYGITRCTSVLDQNNADISSKYYLNLAYQMEAIDGIFVETGVSDPDIEGIFHNAGIAYTKDYATIMKNGKIIYVIDFATEEHELFW